MSPAALQIRPDIADALNHGRPVVALESTLLAQGLPWPDNLETARAIEAAVTASGALPATVAVKDGRLVVGLDDPQLEALAGAGAACQKVSRRDLAVVLHRGGWGATTVAATMAIAHMAGIAVFATGGIGGAHRGAELSFDISADVTELARTPVAVVASGAKSILDLAKTLELLETYGVPVVGYGTDSFPAFYSRSCGLAVPARVDSPKDAAGLIATQRRLALGGLLIANPVPDSLALPIEEVEQLVAQAEAATRQAGIGGKQLTPALLAHLFDLSGGRTLTANKGLLVANGALAGEIALALAALERRA